MTNLGKHVLLGGVALAAMAMGAAADDLSNLKSELALLQARVSDLETQPQAVSAPGYSLLSIRDGQGHSESLVPRRAADRVRADQGFTLSVLPAADAAPAAEVSVSGEIRAALYYTDWEDGDNLDVTTRGRIVVTGKTDTAVGEVGGYLRLQASGGGNLTDYAEDVGINYAYGWWKFAPNWEFMAGNNDSTSALQVGWDWNGASGPTSSFGMSNPYSEQMRLTYSDGTVSAAISLEDPDDITDAEGETIDKSDMPSLQAYLMYTNKPFTGQIVGYYQSDDHGADDWAFGGGATLDIAEGILITAGAVLGEGTSSFYNNLSPLTADEDFWAGSIGLLAQLTEQTRLELGAGIEDYDIAGQALGLGGGLYWDPVSQLTLGAGAAYVDYKDAVTEDHVIGNDDSLEIFFATWLRFP
ncbi:hypothetical protein [Taklimakanibacter albus]|uniref:Uncharacterized protein n=1 Tax=Taklimakanibacter albus TaxID=2800327 RepID=A0ACC5R6A8_9HYPH|nr:hypothetical protein [Aestuariivirga sp. YIM B02566]MBK1868201.1 hypothetical protein [Aestuariivirga sp. YIM B02566]